LGVDYPQKGVALAEDGDTETHIKLTGITVQHTEAEFSTYQRARPYAPKYSITFRRSVS